MIFKSKKTISKYLKIPAIFLYMNSFSNTRISNIKKEFQLLETEIDIEILKNNFLIW